ncbi:MAG: hypothetical protein QM630_06575 [Microbacterium sp.]
MPRRSLTTVTLLGALVALLTGCTTAEIPVVEQDEASTENSVLAIRLSPQLIGINAGATDGYVLLVSESGDSRLLQVGPMDIGKLTWTDSGLFVSGPTDEYLLTDEGVGLFPRGSKEAYETSRFVTPDGMGFVSVYNVGFGEDTYLGRVTTGSLGGVTSWDVTGMFESVSQCEDLVVGITNIAETSVKSEEATPRTDALVQLYPEPASPERAILATLPITEGSFISDTGDAACADGTAYTLAYQYDLPDAEGNGVPVLRAWNTRSGEHVVIPLTTKDGEPLDVPIDGLLGRPSSIFGNAVVWIDVDGRVFSSDRVTGVTAELFQVALTAPEMGESQFLFTETGVFVLDVGQDLDAPLDFSHYDLASGDRNDLMTIPGTGSVHDGLDMIIRDIAVEPRWASTHE